MTVYDHSARAREKVVHPLGYNCMRHGLPSSMQSVECSGATCAQRTHCIGARLFFGSMHGQPTHPKKLRETPMFSAPRPPFIRSIPIMALPDTVAVQLAQRSPARPFMFCSARRATVPSVASLTVQRSRLLHPRGLALAVAACELALARCLFLLRRHRLGLHVLSILCNVYRHVNVLARSDQLFRLKCKLDCKLQIIVAYTMPWRRSHKEANSATSKAMQSKRSKAHLCPGWTP